MTPEEQLAKILKQNQNIVFGKTIGTDADGNCTVQTGESSILARSGGQISAGDCVAMRTDDGQWYAVSSRPTGTVAKRTLYKRKSKPSSASGGDIIILFKKDNALYVGGDRDEPELIYELEAGYSFVGSPNISKIGANIQGYIVNFNVTQGTGNSLVFCSIEEGGLTTKEVLVDEGLGFYIFQQNYFSNLSIGVENTSEPTTPPIPPSDPTCFLASGLFNRYVWVYVWAAPSGILISSIFPLAAFVDMGVPIFIYGYQIIEGVVRAPNDAPYSLGVLSGDVSYLTEIDCHQTETSPTLSTSVSTHKIRSVDLVNDTDLTSSIQLFYADSAVGVLSPPVTGTLPIAYSSNQTISAIQLLQRVDAQTGVVLSIIGIDQESAVARITGAFGADQGYVFHGEGAIRELPYNSFTVPDDLFPDGNPLNGKNLFSLSSPNLVGNIIYSVATSSFEANTGGEIDVLITDIGSTTSFSSESISYRGVPQDFLTSIIDASAYLS